MLEAPRSCLCSRITRMPRICEGNPVALAGLLTEPAEDHPASNASYGINANAAEATPGCLAASLPCIE